MEAVASPGMHSRWVTKNLQWATQWHEVTVIAKNQPDRNYNGIIREILEQECKPRVNYIVEDSYVVAQDEPAPDKEVMASLVNL